VSEPTQAVSEEMGLERLIRRPVIDRIISAPDGARTLELIKSTVAPNCSDAEVGHFLELCAAYGLDPFAREAWCAKGKPKDGQSGKLLIMVGRDGLRKIAQRNGLHLDGDVVRENDDFAVKRTADGDRSIEHSYGKPQDRGPIVGAWAECREGGPLGRPMGYFYAPIGEYKPSNVSAYSPWSKQEGVMCLAAAERQAVRQATPLGGLMAVGEDESANAAAAIGSGGGDGSEPGWHGLSIEMVASIERTMEAAAARGWSLDRGTVQTRLNHQTVEVVEAWIADTYDQIAKLPEPEEIPGADVVPDEPEAQAEPEPGQESMDVDGAS
jgi:hypothetical protein